LQGFGVLRLQNLTISFFRFPLSSKHDLLIASGKNDAIEEADDEIRRSVPSAAGPDHNLKHELAQLAGQIDCDCIDSEIVPLDSDKGRLGIPTRFAIGLLLLKLRVVHEGVCERRVYNPYFQFFTGNMFFQHDLFIIRSALNPVC
jgi:hypothetical protein